jgi:hypothetical protein
METKETQLFREVLSLRNYAPQTIKTYLKAVNSFLQFADFKKPNQNELYKYALSLNEKKMSFSHIKNSVCRTIAKPDVVCSCN